MLSDNPSSTHITLRSGGDPSVRTATTQTIFTDRDVSSVKILEEVKGRNRWEDDKVERSQVSLFCLYMIVADLDITMGIFKRLWTNP